jgi:dCMP deaminase
MVNHRPSWQDYYLGIADSVAVRADCTRRKVGAVVVKANSIISTGYNGSPPGEPGCLSDGACPRGKHYDTGRMYNATLPSLQPVIAHTVCACGKEWPCSESVQPGSSYATGKGSCIALHAEQNALIRAGDRSQGATLYCTDEPCEACMRLVQGAGIATAIWYGGQWDRYTPKKPSIILRAWRLTQALARRGSR